MGRFFPTRITPTVYGVTAGLLAVGVQVFLGLRPPPAYGLCMACHPRDMVSWLVNRLLGANWEIAPVAVAAPLLTTVGLFLGARIAAQRHGEVRRVSLGKWWHSLIYGALVMNAGIIVLGCPTRLLLYSAYGDVLALVGLAGLVVGIVFGTFLLAREGVD
jgi:hypothetical protein